MFRSYLLTAIRHFTKNNDYTILNAIGLSVGLACFTLIGLWVMHSEMSDKIPMKSLIESLRNE